MSWMAWTLPTATFFGAIIASLLAMTLFELWRPTVRRKGWLPMATTRGDRFFISLLGSAFIHILWLALTDVHIVAASLLSLVYAVLVMNRG